MLSWFAVKFINHTFLTFYDGGRARYVLCTLCVFLLYDIRTALRRAIKNAVLNNPPVDHLLSP